MHVFDLYEKLWVQLLQVLGMLSKSSFMIMVHIKQDNLLKHCHGLGALCLVRLTFIYIIYLTVHPISMSI